MKTTTLAVITILSGCTATMDEGGGGGEGSGSGSGSGEGSGSGSGSGTGEEGPTCDPLTGAYCVDEPLPPVGQGYYFSNCATGAAADCIIGNDANDGLSPQTPKRTFAGFNWNTLPAGTNVLLVRGGSWDMPMTILENNNVTPTAPLVIRAYGTGPTPLLRATQNIIFQLGGLYNNQTNDGGYVIRDMHLDGLGAGQWGFWFVQNVTGAHLFHVEIEGFELGLHASGGEPYGVNHLTLESSYIHHNSGMGFLGSPDDSIIENNVFEANNFSGSGLNHAIYFSNFQNTTIRGNRFLRNSVVNGRCTGGNVTIHGVVDGLLIEDNVITQDAGDGGCYGFSITAGYTSAEIFENVIVRNNIVKDTGNCAVCIDSAPGALVEGNVSIKSDTAWHAAVLNPPHGEEDAVTSGATVRNNTRCQASPNSQVDAVRFMGPSTTQSNNVSQTGAAATTGVCAPL
jgi:Right handed beta helix region